MGSAFDTRAARFDPEQAAALQVAYRLALQAMSPHDRLPTTTKSKLAKVVVKLGQERLHKHLALDVEAISAQAAAVMQPDLRALAVGAP